MATDQGLDSAPATATASSDPTERPPTTPISSSPTVQDEGAPSILPAKRPFEALTTFFLDEGDLYHCRPGEEPAESYGPVQDRCYKAYLNSQHRLDDTTDLNKDTGEKRHQRQRLERRSTPKEKRGMSRSEAKALDREIPWRRILDMDPADIQSYIAAAEKEAKSWTTGALSSL